MATSVLPPYPLFYDIDGVPLEEGYIYIGVAGLNPETNPQAVYWDAALTIPASQPIRTLNGYPANSGTPAMIYTSTTDFSLTVKTKDSVTVYSALNNTYASSLGTMALQNANAVAITGGTITGLSSPLPVASGGTGGATQSAARAGIGLLDMAIQAPSAVAITGGTINGTTLGASTPAAGTFTELVGYGKVAPTATGTLVAADAGCIVVATGGLTLPAGVMGAMRYGMIFGNGTARTITRGVGLTMLFNGVDTASVTLSANGFMGYVYGTTNLCNVYGSIS